MKTNHDKQLSFDALQVEESVKVYHLDTQMDESLIQKQLERIALSEAGAQAIIDKACDVIDRKFAERGEVFSSPEQIKKALKARMAHLEHEEFAMIFLDNKLREIAFKVLFRGTIDSANVYPREVVKDVLKTNAAGVIFCHNHPGGDPSPSGPDLRITERLKSALSLIDVRVLDHIIVGAGRPYSMAENGQI